MVEAHTVTYHCPMSIEGGMAIAWIARCSCGARQPDPADGTMASAKMWRDEHWAAMRSNEPRPVRLDPDAPDPSPDTYDAFLRGVTRDAR